MLLLHLQIGDVCIMPHIRIGNQTCCRVPARLAFEFAVNNGFDAFEWFSDPGPAGWHENDIDARLRQSIRQTGREQNIRFSVHAPWVADPVTESGQKAILCSIAFAGDIAAEVVNIHLFDEYPADAYAGSLPVLIDAAYAAGAILSVENTPRCSPEFVNAVFAALGKYAGRSVGLCLDMGHANLFAETRGDYPAYVARLAGNVPIVHWHVHENHGDRDSHLPLFTGPSSLDDGNLRRLTTQLKQRGFSGSAIMEQWPDPPEILVAARQRLLQLWES